jgi:hypothetical protein
MYYGAQPGAEDPRAARRRGPAIALGQRGGPPRALRPSVRKSLQIAVEMLLPPVAPCGENKNQLHLRQLVC